MIPVCILVIENDSDREFMEQLYIQYSRLMFDTVNKICHNFWASEDVVQIALEKLIDKIQLLRSLQRDNRICYVLATCRNLAFNYLRQSKRVTFLPFDETIDSFESEDCYTSIEEKLDLMRDLDALAAIWSKLDERTRQLLEGRYLSDKTDDELSKELGIKISSVRMALTRARKKAYKLLLDKIEDR